MSNLFEVVKDSILYHIAGIHTAIPGKIVKFDPDTQEATVKILVKEVFLDDREFDIPEIDGVPVMFPSGGGGSVTFPIQAGDGVLIIFSERSLDMFLQSAKNEPVSPGDKRRHNPTDAIAIPGLTSFKRATSSRSDAVEVKYKGSSILLKDDGNVEITPASGTLKVNGDIQSTGEVTAKSDTLPVNLSTHIHPAGSPNTAPPTPGT